jgi:hypothetical protein
MSTKDLTSKLLAAMESEPSGISDGNNSGLPIASECASVLPVDSSRFSNLGNDDPLQGLAAMGKVAGEAEPQRLLSVVKPPLQPTNQMIFDLVENNIEVTVPVIKTIITTMSLDSVRIQGNTRVGRPTQPQSKARNYQSVFTWAGGWFYGTVLVVVWKLVQRLTFCQCNSQT